VGAGQGCAVLAPPEVFTLCLHQGTLSALGLPHGSVDAREHALLTDKIEHPRNS